MLWQLKLAVPFDKLNKLIYKFLLKYINKLIGLFDYYGEKIFTKNFYEKARKRTKPLHWTWILAWKFYNKRYQRIGNLLLKPGVHLISAPTGGGKTSLVYNLIEYLKSTTGKSSYINNPFEKVREIATDNYGSFIKYRNHTLCDFKDFWSNGLQHYQLDSDKYAAFVIDELHRELDYRTINTTEYHQKFKPFHDFCVLNRHQKIIIYATTQMDKTDIQLMQMATFHELQIEKGFNYDNWLDDGEFKNGILGWHIDSYKCTTNGSGGIDRHLIKSWYLPTTADMKYYETYSMANTYKHLPFYNKKRKD